MVHLRGVDLNLALVLHVLLEEASVTRAARRLGLSQSATSHALARLREVLGDPLFVRTPDGLVPTVRAEGMRQSVARALGELERALHAEAPFDPGTARGTFRIGTSDYAELVMLPSLLTRLGAAAPNLDVAVGAAPVDVAEALAKGQTDLVLGPRQPNDPQGLKVADLWSDRFVVVMRRGHPLSRGKLTVARFAAARHAFIAPRGRPGGVVDEALAKRGLSRRIAFMTPNFLVAPQVIARTDLVITLAARVAQAFARALPLTVLEPPLPLPNFRIAMYWHERKHTDPAHRYLRAELTELARELPAAERRR